jgi:hypothetical protein
MRCLQPAAPLPGQLRSKGARVETEKRRTFADRPANAGRFTLPSLPRGPA